MLPDRMQRNDRERPDPLDNARRRCGFARPQHASCREHRDGKIIQRARRSLRAALDRFELLTETLRTGKDGDPAVGRLAGKFANLRSIRRDLDRNRIFEIDVAVVRMHKANPALARAVDSTSSPRSSLRTISTYARSRSTGIGGRPIVLRPVKPVPTPRIARPGASRLIVAIECAVTGSIRFDGIATPVPSLIRFVFSAASAMQT